MTKTLMQLLKWPALRHRGPNDSASAKKKQKNKEEDRSARDRWLEIHDAEEYQENKQI